MKKSYGSMGLSQLWQPRFVEILRIFHHEYVFKIPFKWLKFSL